MKKSKIFTCMFLVIGFMLSFIAMQGMFAQADILDKGMMVYQVGYGTVVQGEHFNIQDDYSINEYQPLIDLPTGWDPREHDNSWLTPGKHQVMSGPCMIFAGTANLESFIKLTTGQEIILSENHAGFATSGNFNNRVGLASYTNRHANEHMLAAYWLRTMYGGPVLASECYPNRDRDEIGWNRNAPRHGRVTGVQWIRNIDFANGESPGTNEGYRNQIKEAIYRYGSVAARYNHRFIYPDLDAFNRNPVYNGDDRIPAYFRPPRTVAPFTNHSAQIVGWCDNYSADNFAGSQLGARPPGDGAWLVKDSSGPLGTGHRLMWMSYYQVLTEVFFVTGWDPDFDGGIFEYTPHGGFSNISFRGGTTIYSANVFESHDEGSYLQEVTVFIGQPNTTYSIYVATGEIGGNRIELLSRAVQYPRVGVLTAQQFRHRGFYTIRLETPIPIGNKSFAVVLQTRTQVAGVHALAFYEAPAPAAARNDVNRVIHPDESFFGDGHIWNDMYYRTMRSNFLIYAIVSGSQGGTNFRSRVLPPTVSSVGSQSATIYSSFDGKGVTSHGDGITTRSAVYFRVWEQSAGMSWENDPRGMEIRQEWNSLINGSASAIFSGLRPNIGYYVQTVSFNAMGKRIYSEIEAFRTLTAGEVVNSWTNLRRAIHAVPANTPTTILIESSFATDPTTTLGNVISIPANRYITLESTNTEPGVNNVRVLTQTRSGQRHFHINANGNLTLGQYITLSGGEENNANDSGGVNIQAGGTFTMNEGSIIENCRRTSVNGGGVLVNDSTNANNRSIFNLNGGIIRSNTALRGGGVATGALSVMTMNGGYITGNTATGAHGGGGIHASSSNSTLNITDGVISNNTANEGGGIRLGSVNSILTMTGGSITNNTATYGGGIFSTASNTATHLPATAYRNLSIGTDVIFSGNRATAGASAPPDNRLDHIAATTSSIWHYVLNNYDINYIGRLNQFPPSIVNSWVDLRRVISATPANAPTTILIGSSFAADVGTTAGNAIAISAGRHITLLSTNTEPGVSNMRILTQARNGQRHFIIDANSSLTLEQNITLSGGEASNTNNSGGVHINRGTFTMNEGSIIENCRRTAVNGGGVLVNDSTNANNRSIFNLNGGIIRNNTALRGGGVATGALSVMTMNGGYITGNTAIGAHGGGGIHASSSNSTLNITDGVISNNTANEGGGIRLGSVNSILTMTGGSIINNTATYGGGIFSTAANTATHLPATAYRNLSIGTDVIFSGNRATAGASAPPDNRLAHLTATTSSIWHYVLNNYDINYVGRLGVVPLPTTTIWQELYDIIDEDPENEPTNEAPEDISTCNNPEPEVWYYDNEYICEPDICDTGGVAEAQGLEYEPVIFLRNYPKIGLFQNDTLIFTLWV